uniref:Auxin efflux carrier n=1 Tax=Chrysotila carterae TaxID=13221 RepID=A0A7S4F3I8_CHRCT
MEIVGSFLLQIFLSSVQALLAASVPAFGGFLLAWLGYMPESSTRVISSISAKATIPCLLFVRVLEGVDLQLLADSWIMVLLPPVVVTVGALVGMAVVFICKPPNDFRNGTIAAVALGNSTGMPIVLLSVIYAQLGYLWAEDDSHPHAHEIEKVVTDPVAYLGIYLLVYPIVQWGIGGWLLAPQTKALLPSIGRQISNGSAARMDGGVVSASMSERMSRSENSVENLTHLEMFALGETHGRRYTKVGASHSYPRKGWPHRLRRLAAVTRRTVDTGANVLNTICQRIFVPPVIGVVLGLVCASQPHLFWLLCGGELGHIDNTHKCPAENAVLGSLSSGLRLLGNAAVPLNLMLLGISLSKGPSWESLPLPTTMAIVVAKMVVMPFLGAALIYVLDVYFTGIFNAVDPYDIPIYLAIATVTATPSANNLLVMANAAGGNVRAMGTVIFAQYLMAPVLLSISLTVVVVASVAPADHVRWYY